MKGRRAPLLVVYHRPFWRASDGSLWEREGAFSRYLESLSPHFQEILLAAPLSCPLEDGRRLAADNVYLVPLPFFDRLTGFYRVLPGVLGALWWAVGRVELVNLRLPTPAGVWAFWLARVRRRPVFLLMVGDLAGVARSVPADSLKRRLFHWYICVEERLSHVMAKRSLTFTNGGALYEKYALPGRLVFETRNSTIRQADVARPREPYLPPRARLLSVSRVDTRKGLRNLPRCMAVLRAHGLEPILDVIGPTVGQLGQEEKTATLQAAARLGLDGAIQFQGPASLEEVHAAYTRHDLLVVPSLPGEGIPRVLLEAMAAGTPIVATKVGGVADLVRDGENGLLVPPGNGRALGEAAARLLLDAQLRERCVQNGYATARAHTADAQAAWLVELLDRHFRASGREPSAPRPLRITIPLAGLNLSGGVKSLLLLANRLVERGAHVQLIVPDYAATPPVALDPRVEMRVVATAGAGRLRQLSYFVRLSARAAADADVVLANYYLTTYPALISRLRSGRRAALAYNVRGYEPWSHGLMAPASRVSRWLRFVLARLSYRLPLKKLVTSDWLKAMVGDPQAVVVGHGIDLEQFRPLRSVKALPESRLVVVGVVGRQGAVKGYPDFLAAVDLLPPDLEVKFLVARADPVDLPNGRIVHTVQARTEAEMAAFYNRCDSFVFPSLAEGFGLPALESMACGCALVTTDCGGVAAFARAEDNCLMVPPGRPDLLAGAIERLARDPELRRRLSARGVETAQRFDRLAATDRLADAILDLASRGRSTERTN